ncbi:MAG: energy-coupling factor transporter ATPase [Clostridia bacterium]|nr:energy-coupling factor transporter ATPase [Clostridia bacterium]
MNIIETKELSFSYKRENDEKVVLDGLNIDIKEGSFTAIIGHNGSGKSTFAKHINAILLPCGGSITVCGIDTSDEKKLYELRKSAGMVFQNPDNQIVATIVEEDVAFGLENLAIDREEMHRRVEAALKAVNMYEHRKRAPHLLSGGQKQRVAIAGILAMQPRCIVLDEPTAMLDPQGRREVMDTILSLNRENNITIVLITHYMDEAAKADRVIVLDKGKVRFDAPPREVFREEEKLRDLGLSVPDSTALVHALRKKGINIEKETLTPKECAEEILSVTVDIRTRLKR